MTTSGSGIVSGQDRPSPVVPMIIGSALLMQTLDATIVAAALPEMARFYRTDVLTLNVAITSYVIGMALMLPVSGWIADRFGTRTVFLWAIGGFVAASLLCAASAEIWQLVAARALQGMAGALMMPVGRMVLLRTTPRHHYIRALSYLTIPLMLGPVLGPPVGGLIVANTAWQWIFLINVPIGLLGLVLAAPRVPQLFGPRMRLDLRGLGLAGAALASFVFAVETAGRQSVNGWVTAALLVMSALCVAAYLRHDQRTEGALLDLELLSIQTYRASILGGFFTRLTVGVAPFLLSLLFQLGFGLAPLTSGLLILMGAVGAIAMRSSSTELFAVVGFRRLLVISGAATAVTFAAIALLTATTPLWVIGTLLLVHGFLRSLLFTGINALAYSDVPEPRMGAAATASGMSNLVAQAVAIGGSALLMETLRQLNGGEVDAGVIRPTFVLIGVAALLSLAWFVRLPHDAGNSLVKTPLDRG